MGTAQDTFVRFVDLLASNIDDHEADGARLAARMHISRFHCCADPAQVRR